MYVVEQNIPTCPCKECNPGRWIYRQTLYPVAVKVSLYRKAVEVYYIYLATVTFTPPILNSSLNFLVQESCEMRLREIFMHRKIIEDGLFTVGAIVVERKYSNLSQFAIKPGSLDLQANILPCHCESRLHPQGSSSVLYIQ